MTSHMRVLAYNVWGMSFAPYKYYRLGTFFLGNFGFVTYISFAFLLYMIIVRRVSSYFYHEVSSFFYIMMIMQCSVTILAHNDNSQDEGAQQASSAFC